MPAALPFLGLTYLSWSGQRRISCIEGKTRLPVQIFDDRAEVLLGLFVEI